MKKNKNKTLQQLKIQAGLDRKVFFENGGELSRWRGMHQVFKDKKKARSKKTCRGHQKWRK